MACITSLDQNVDRSWAGRAIKTGEISKFNTLDDYKQYTQSLQTQGTYCPVVEPHYTSAYKPGENRTPSGFMEFQPRDPVGQAKHSAMSDTWEGIESSNQAIARGDYSLDMAEANRADLRAQKHQTVLQMPKGPVDSGWNCIVQ
jgi:hypothetical protein